MAAAICGGGGSSMREGRGEEVSPRLGSELSGKAAHKTPKVLVSEPRESSYLTFVNAHYENVQITHSHAEVILLGE